MPLRLFYRTFIHKNVYNLSSSFFILLFHFHMPWNHKINELWVHISELMASFYNMKQLLSMGGLSWRVYNCRWRCGCWCGNYSLQSWKQHLPYCIAIDLEKTLILTFRKCGFHMLIGVWKIEQCLGNQSWINCPHYSP